MSHFVYKLIPPRPTFAGDMSEREAGIMGQHFAYWEQHLATGKLLVYGPVADPAGVWGLGILAVDGVEEARALVDADPAIASGLGTCEIHPMDAIVSGQPA